MIQTKHTKAELHNVLTYITRIGNKFHKRQDYLQHILNYCYMDYNNFFLYKVQRKNKNKNTLNNQTKSVWYIYGSKKLGYLGATEGTTPLTRSEPETSIDV